MRVFGLIALLVTMRLIISLIAQNSWKFSNGCEIQFFELTSWRRSVCRTNHSWYRYIYIYIYGHENRVPKLKITLYGIKQTLRAWNNRIDQYFHDNNFVWYLYEHALYIKVNEKSDILLVGLDVNCLIFIGTNPIMFSEFKEVIG